MDFNPLDLLAAAALGDNNAKVEITTPGRQSVSGRSDELLDADSPDGEESDMGKSGSNRLIPSDTKETTTAAMAPQKAPWGPEFLLHPSSLGQPVLKKEMLTLDDIVKGIKTNDLDTDLKKIMGRSFMDDNHIKNQLEDSSAIGLRRGQNNNLVAIKNEINLGLNESLSGNPQVKEKIKTDVKDEDSKDFMFTSEVKQELPDDVKSVDSGVSGGDCSPTSDTAAIDSRIHDHCYAMAYGQTVMRSTYEYDDIDIGCGMSPLMEDSEQRSRNLSLDCNYLKSGIMAGVSANTLDLYNMAVLGHGRAKIPSTSSSNSSPTIDLGCRSSSLVGDNCDHFTEPSSSRSPCSSTSSPTKPCHKYGKFKIGTFASFSSGNLELEKYLRNQDCTGHKKLKIGIPSEPHAVESTLNSPAAVQSFLQSPSRDWDRSEVGSETHDDSSDARTPYRLSPDFTTEKVTEWSHPLYHDHDYCTKEEFISKPDESKKTVQPKRKYTKRKNKNDLANHEKIMKAKYLKKELLKQDTFIKHPVSPITPEPVFDDSLSSLQSVSKSRKRQIEKLVQEEIDPATGTKMKITGKFQDQYVYSLPKSSRSTTRRQQTPSLPHLLDKIILPPPKPGDIVVHHLTDTDIETVRLKGRAALNLPERPNHIYNLPTSTAPSFLANTTHCPPCSSQSNEAISDGDIVSTILSMENDNLSSPSTPHPPTSTEISNTTDLASTVGINPHQPALTESLRQISGDPSITSEHVINYLLSVANDENLLSNAGGFDSSTSSLFPSIPPDAIYSKADMSESGLVNNTSTSFATGASTGSFSHGQTAYSHSVNKSGLDDNSDLPDDFSSFISNSQESSTCGQPDSQSSLKSMFGSDLSSLGTPQLSTSVPQFTSIEKTLDYLGVKDGEIKLEAGSYADSFSDSHPMNNGTTPSTPQSDIQEDETPWIVTVTLYFNDVPAIMINSQPFIRLVDIHKQILPAKDTGILKKRCQLLNIPVQNCSEMQRYFVVQYGRAYNSKSTLVVSKEQATKLVSYYAVPQPRNGRSEDPNHHRPSSRSSDSGASLTRSPVWSNQSGLSKRQGLNVSPGLDIDRSHLDDGKASQTKRTRHKKINYLEMLKGEEKIPTEDSILETIEAVVRSAPDYVKEGKTRKKSKKSRKNDHRSSDRKSKSSSDRKKSSKSKKHDKKSRKHSHKDKDRHRSSSYKKKSSNKSVNSHDFPLEKQSLSSEQDGSDVMVDHSLQKKFKPLKLKVNSLLNFTSGHKRSASSSPSSTSSPAKKAGLFSRSDSIVNPVSPHILSVASSITQQSHAPQSTSSNCTLNGEPTSRILAVAHQAASQSSGGESKLPCQPADINLDLFTKPSSACVQCRTCSQYLSVPHFMRHHHVPMDNKWLASEAAQRILVPFAGSNASGGQRSLSDHERRLWEEFHSLQESIGGFGEGDGESDNSDVDYEDEDSEDEEGEESSIHTSIHSHVAQAKFRAEQKSNTLVKDTGDSQIQKSKSKISSFVASPAIASAISNSHSVKFNHIKDNKGNAYPSEAALSKIGLIRRDSAGSSNSTSGSNVNKTTVQKVSPAHAASTALPLKQTPVDPNVRHSSRKRKSKQFFDIENYDNVPKKTEETHVNCSAPYR